MKKLFISFLILSLPFIVQAEDNTSPFSDIEKGHKYFKAVSYLKDKGVINGYEDGTFKPDLDVNRAEALKIIFLGLSKNIEETGSGTTLEQNLFPDTPNDAWYIPYIKYAKERDIVKGYEDGLFRPEKNVTLVEALKIISLSQDLDYPNLEDLDYSKYPDININEWYGRFIAYAIENNLITPYPKNNRFYPNFPLTRGEIIDIIYKLSINLETGKAYKYEDFGQTSFYGDGFQGNPTASGDIFDMNAHSAAHQTLPFGTFVRVTDPDNPEKSVVVKINDRGGFEKYGRILDLSKAAFEALESTLKGVTDVNIKEVDFEPGAHKKYHSISSDLPELFKQAITFPSIIQTYEYYVINLNPESPTTINLLDKDGKIVSSQALNPKQNNKVSLFFTKAGTYSIVIEDKQYGLFIFDRLEERKSFLPDISENNFNLKILEQDENIMISWNPSQADRMYLLSIKDESSLKIDFIVQNTTEITIKKSIFDKFLGKELYIVLSERSSFTGFSLDEEGPWQPIAKERFMIE